MKPTRFVPDSVAHYQSILRVLRWCLSVTDKTAERYFLQIFQYKNKTDVLKAINRRNDEFQVDGECVDSFDSVMAKMDVERDIASNVRDLLPSLKMNERVQRSYCLAEIDLTQNEPELLSSFALQRKIMELASSKSTKTSNYCIDDYAILTYSSVGKSVVRLTILGHALATIFQSSVEKRKIETDSELVDAIFDAEKLMFQHKENPWLKSRYLEWVSKYWYQTDWSGSGQGLDDQGILFFKTLGHDHAKQLLPLAIETIEQMDGFYGIEKNNAEHPKTYIGADFDCFSYPALLFWGGKIALNAGDFKRAEKWFKANYRLTKSDNFGARFYLSLFAVSEPKKCGKAFYKPDYLGPWARLTGAADCFNNNDHNGLRENIVNALVDSASLFALYSRSCVDWREFKVMNNHETVSHVHEWEHYLSQVWRDYPHFRQYMIELCNNSQIHRAVIEHERARVKCIGVAYTDSEERKQVTKNREEAFSNLNHAIMNA